MTEEFWIVKTKTKSNTKIKFKPKLWGDMQKLMNKLSLEGYTWFEVKKQELGS